MGVLFHKETLTTHGFLSEDASVFANIIEEVKAIIKGSTLEKKGRIAETNGFDIEILKSTKDKAFEKCKILNEVFTYKSFEPESFGNSWLPVCRNYFDRVHVTMDYRIHVDLDYEEDRQKLIFERFQPNNEEFLIPGFKLYWNYHTASIYLYLDSRHRMWSAKDAEAKKYHNAKAALDQLISILRKCF